MWVLLQSGTTVLWREKSEEKKEESHLPGLEGTKFSRVYTCSALCNSGVIPPFGSRTGRNSFACSGWLNGSSICTPGSVGTFPGVWSDPCVQEEKMGDPCLYRDIFWISSSIDF